MARNKWMGDGFMVDAPQRAEAELIAVTHGESHAVGLSVRGTRRPIDPPRDVCSRGGGTGHCHGIVGTLGRCLTQHSTLMVEAWTPYRGASPPESTRC